MHETLTRKQTNEQTINKTNKGRCLYVLDADRSSESLVLLDLTRGQFSKQGPWFWERHGFINPLEVTAKCTLSLMNVPTSCANQVGFGTDMPRLTPSNGVKAELICLKDFRRFRFP